MVGEGHGGWRPHLVMGQGHGGWRPHLVVGEGHGEWGAHLVKKQGEKGKWTYINYLKGDQRTRKLTAEATNEKKKLQVVVAVETRCATSTSITT